MKSSFRPAALSGAPRALVVYASLRSMLPVNQNARRSAGGGVVPPVVVSGVGELPGVCARTSVVPSAKIARSGKATAPRRSVGIHLTMHLAEITEFRPPTDARRADQK